MTFNEKWYNFRFFRQFCSNWNKKVHEKVKDLIPSDAIVMDVGCGSGEFLILSSEKLAQGIGLDLSDKLIKQAKAKKKYNII